jgi:hypothetical protein
MHQTLLLDGFVKPHAICYTSLEMQHLNACLPPVNSVRYKLIQKKIVALEKVSSISDDQSKTRHAQCIIYEQHH